MKALGRWATAAGLVLAAVLFWREGVGPIVATLRAAGYGMLLAALVHAVPMLLNARGWQSLLLADAQCPYALVAMATWVRESVNGSLPVARIGGEVAACRMLTKHGVAPVAASASLVVDMVVSMLSQATFALLGVVLAIRIGLGTDLSWQLGGGTALLFVSAAVCSLFFRSSAFAKLTRVASRFVAGPWRGLASEIDARLRVVHADRRAMIASFAWQIGGWFAGALEIAVALYFLGHALSFERVLLIEASIQAISSIAFVVPGAVGVQEGAFLLIGTALGLDGPTSLALAATRRLRDLIVFVPGLVVWHIAEWRGRSPTASSGGWRPRRVAAPARD